MLRHATLCSPASRKTEEKSRGQSRRKPSSEPVAQKDEDTLMLLMAMPGPGTHTHTKLTTTCPPRQVPSLCLTPCFEQLSSKHLFSSTDFIPTCVKSPFFPAVRMLLLCRQQPPDVFNNNSAVVDFEDMATPAASKSIDKKKTLWSLSFQSDAEHIYTSSKSSVQTDLLTHSVRSSTCW